jgi:hypothetical protein
MFVALSSSSVTSPALAQATVSQKCSDGSVVTVSTGNSGGECGSPYKETQACNDGNGNYALGGCGTNGAGCGKAGGSGTCTITALRPPKGTGPAQTGINAVGTKAPVKLGGSGAKPVAVVGGIKAPIKLSGSNQPVIVERATDEHSGGGGKK